MWMNDYKPEEYSKSFDVADGDHVVVIYKVENKVSKNGSHMHEVTYMVKDSNGVPFIDRIVEGEYYNKNMTRFFDAFHIQRGDFNFNNWLNKKAYAHFEHKQETFTNSNGQQVTVNKANLVYFHNNMPGSENNPTVSVDFNKQQVQANASNNGQFIPGQGWN